MALHNRDESQWDELLSPSGKPTSADETLRNTLLQRSTRVLHRRRRARQITLVVALVACYAAGLGSAQLANSGGNTPILAKQHQGQDTQGTSEVSPGANDVVGATGSASADTVGTSEPANYVRVIEQKEPTVQQPEPARKPPSRFEQLRRISDRYLYERSDVTAAIRGYRQALAVATEEELAIATDKDSWLLIALKQERM